MVEYARFTESGFTFVASYAPGERGPEWVVTVSANGAELENHRIPMEYEPRYGPDVVDVQALEAFTDKRLAELAAGAGS